MSAVSRFGDAVLVAFLIAQALDGVLTYVGVASLGPGAEGNPLVATLIPWLGLGATVAAAKIFAGSLGIVLYLRGVHAIVAALTGFYFAAAVLPWARVLFLH
jgi:hypothetical protein